MKWKANTAQWGVLMKINNENENIYYISIRIEFSWIHVMENNIKITFQLMRRHET